MSLIALPLPVSQWFETARQFWDWWLRELWACVPASIKARLISKARTDIRLRGGGVELLCSDAGTLALLREDRSLDALDEASWEELSGLLIDRTARLILEDRDVLCFELNVPRASGRDLPSVIAIQLEIMSPIDPRQISWTWAPVRVERASAAVLVALARTSRLAEIDRLFAQHGQACPPIHCETPAGIMRLRRGRNRLESAYRCWERRVIVWSTLLLAAFPLLLLVGALLLTAIDRAKLNDLRREAGPKLAGLRDARRNVRLWQAYGPMHAIPSAAMMLGELGERAPEGTGIDTVDFTNGRSIRFDWTGTVSAPALSTFTQAPGRLVISQPAGSEPLTSPVALSATLK